MFGFFNKKKLLPTVSLENKSWIEGNINWLIRIFGSQHLNTNLFILPTNQNFPYSDLKDENQFNQLFEKLCSLLKIDSKEINVKIFDDIQSKQWNNLAPVGPVYELSGHYYESDIPGEKKFNIRLAKSNLHNAQFLIAVIAHELSHVKLLGGKFVDINAPDMEALTDLATIFFGFGIFTANSCIKNDNNWIDRTGYLPNESISYANAVMCYIIGTKPEKVTPHLNINTKALFHQDYDFLLRTDETLLSPTEIKNSNEIYEANKHMADGFKERNFTAVIEGSRRLLKVDAENTGAFNNIGYALLLQKKYNEAIDAFNKAIDIDPYWDYPFNNRGYCKLQLGIFDDAFADLHSSFEMNPTNSFSWRNLGAYYLQTNEPEKALRHFEEAEKIDPKTELINFYLGHTHKVLGNYEKANHYFVKSKEADEYNYSMLKEGL